MACAVIQGPSGGWTGSRSTGWRSCATAKCPSSAASPSASATPGSAGSACSKRRKDAVHRGGEGPLRRLAAAGREPLHELPVGEPDEGPPVEEHAKATVGRPLTLSCHELPLHGSGSSYPSKAAEGRAVPAFWNSPVPG